MSGIEVVGVVLGAIPLIVAALENYSKGLDAMTAFLKWRGELALAIQQLWFYHTEYVQSVELLLQPITTPQEFHIMIAEPQHNLWKDKRLEEALKIKLGGAYDAYIRILSNIEHIVKALAKGLDIKGADKVSQRGLQALVLANQTQKKRDQTEFEFTRRVSFALKRKEIRKLLLDFKTCIQQLDSYATKADKLEIARGGCEPQRRLEFSLPLHSIEGKASKLYEIIRRTWCQDHVSHHSGLLLEQRLVRRRRRKSGTADQHCNKKEDSFGISLFRSLDPQRWLDAEVRVLEASSRNQQSTTSVTTAAPGATSPLQQHSAQLIPDPSHLQIVTNLCATLTHPCKNWLGFCVDHNGNLRGSYETSPRGPGLMEQGTSLAAVLGRGHQMSQADVYHLSVTLSSSLLQLFNTPWLFRSWTKEDIVFLRLKNVSDKSVDVRHPFLAREQTSRDRTTIGHADDQVKDSYKLRSLAILLTEVASGQPIESLRRLEDFGPNHIPNSMTDVQAAQRWLSARKDGGNLTMGFYSAIIHCLSCSIDHGVNLQDARFRESVEEKVLGPLLDEMILLFG